jgi:hypothetical protein
MLVRETAVSAHAGCRFGLSLPGLPKRKRSAE